MPVEPRRQPVFESRRQCGIADVGPRARRLRVDFAREHETLAQRPRLLGPRQRFETELADACEQCVRHALAVGIVQSPLAEPDRAEPALVLRDDGLFARIPFESLAVLDERSEIRFECGARQRRCQPDQRLAVACVEIRDDQEFRLRDALRVRSRAPRPPDNR